MDGARFRSPVGVVALGALLGLVSACTADAYFLLDLKYVYTGGAFAFPAGLFRDRSQLSARVTFLLN